MKILSFIQIGDIHYPLHKDDLTADIKAGGSREITDAVGRKKLAIVLKEVDRQLHHNQIENVLFMGDFTDKGCSLEFKNCLKTITSSLNKHLEKCISVPGNHDLTCNTDDYKFHKKLEAKFDDFRKISESNFLKNFLIYYEDHKHFEHLEKRFNTFITTINTALGSNEITFIEKYEKLIEKLGRKNIKELIGEDFHEYFDCPFVHSNVLTDIRHKTQNGLMPIIVAHHNLLPQRIARFALFPELINSGHVRDTFAEISQPTIYLHGHTHDDHIEIVNHQDNYQSIGIIAISAPEMIKGFNIITIVFSEDKTPLAIDVEKMRFSGPELKRIGSKKFQFYPETKFKDCLNTEEIKLYEQISAKSGRIRYKTFKDKERELINLELIGMINIHKKIQSSQETWSISLAREY